MLFRQCPGVPDGLSERMSECEEAQRYDRSAALAVFHGDLRAAVLVSIHTSRCSLCVEYTVGFIVWKVSTYRDMELQMILILISIRCLPRIWLG